MNKHKIIYTKETKQYLVQEWLRVNLIQRIIVPLVFIIVLIFIITK